MYCKGQTGQWDTDDGCYGVLDLWEKYAGLTGRLLVNIRTIYKYTWIKMQASREKYDWTSERCRFLSAAPVIISRDWNAPDFSDSTTTRLG